MIGSELRVRDCSLQFFRLCDLNDVNYEHKFKIMSFSFMSECLRVDNAIVFHNSSSFCSSFQQRCESLSQHHTCMILYINVKRINTVKDAPNAAPCEKKQETKTNIQTTKKKDVNPQSLR